VNKRFQALRQFGNWVVRSRRLAHNPFQGLTGRKEDTDRRRVRRALTDAEVARFLDAARRRPLEEGAALRTRAGLSPKARAKFAAVGEARAFLYEFAIGTGLRRGELQGLVWADIDEASGTLTVRATVAKSKRMQDLPLRQDILASLLVHKARVSKAGHATAPQDRVFPGPLFPTHMTFAADLKHAGLDAPDDQGRIIDFHSTRLTFVTRLSVAKVHPRIAQALARHSKLDLTMRVYTDVRLLDLRSAVEATPAVISVPV
jgi:integrase